MSVLIVISRVKLQKKPLNKIRLNVYTPNDELSSKEQMPGMDPDIQLSFLLSKTVKQITLIVEEYIAEDKWHIIGKTNFYLYSVDEIKKGEKAVKLVNLEKVVQGNVQNDLDRIAGSAVLEISRSSKRKILTEIEEIQFVKKKQNIVWQANDVKEQQQIYEEVSITLSEKQAIHLQPAAKAQIRQENSLYEVDHEGLVTLKPLKHQVQLHQILQQLDYFSIPQEKLHLTQQEFKEYSSLDPNKLRESVVVKHIKMKEPNKKPQIFTSPPQKDHIDLNIDSNMFQAYHMCCGDQIDRSHQLQETY